MPLASRATVIHATRQSLIDRDSTLLSAAALLAQGTSIERASTAVQLISDRAVAQIFPEAWTVGLCHHPVYGRLRMILKKAANVTVGADARDSRIRQELLPFASRPRSEDFADFADEFFVMFPSRGRTRKSGVRREIRTAYCQTKASPFTVEGARAAPMTVKRKRDPQAEQVIFRVTAKGPGTEPVIRKLIATFWQQEI